MKANFMNNIRSRKSIAEEAFKVLEKTERLDEFNRSPACRISTSNISTSDLKQATKEKVA